MAIGNSDLRLQCREPNKIRNLRHRYHQHCFQFPFAFASAVHNQMTPLLQERKNSDEPHLKFYNVVGLVTGSQEEDRDTIRHFDLYCSHKNTIYLVTNIYSMCMLKYHKGD